MYLSLAFFYFITPFCEAPAWCISYYRRLDQHGPFFDCDAAEGGIVPTSNFQKFAPALTCTLDLICLSFLMYFVWFKSQWKAISKFGKARLIIMIVIYCISFIDSIWSIVETKQPYLTNTMRPLVVLILLP